MKSTITIVKQEYPDSKRPYMIIENAVTIDGIRSRISAGRFIDFESAKFEAEIRYKIAFGDILK